MKSALVAFLALLATAPAHATVVDYFDCHLNFVSDDGQVNTSTHDTVSAVRLASAVPTPVVTPTPDPTATPTGTPTVGTTVPGPGPTSTPEPVPSPSTTPAPSPYADVVYTAGSVDMNLNVTIGGHFLQLFMGTWYQHVVATTNDGVTRAGQEGCTSYGFSVDHSGASSACASSVSPGDPLAGYNPVALVDGVPAFDASILTPVSARIAPYGTVTGQCTYTGTQQ